MAEVGELNVRLTAKGSDLASEVAAARRALHELGEQSKTTSSVISNSFREAAGGIGLGRVVGATSAVGAAIGITEIISRFNSAQYESTLRDFARGDLNVAATRGLRSRSGVQARVGSIFDDNEARLRQLDKEEEEVSGWGWGRRVWGEIVGDDQWNRLRKIREARERLGNTTSGSVRRALGDLGTARDVELERRREQESIDASIRGMSAAGTTAVASLEAEHQSASASLRTEASEIGLAAARARRLQNNEDADYYDELLRLKQKEIDAEDALYERQKLRLQVVTQLQQIGASQAVAGSQAGSFPLSDVAFASDRAMSDSVGYLWAIGVAVSGVP